MAKANIEDIRKQLAERVGAATLEDSKELKDLGLDSLDIVEMCLDLEDSYGIKFSTDELAGLKTVGDLLGAVASKIG